ncbi:MAG: NADH-quinone oxidoreductase subunit C [Euryarchaeota archaeon TMED192]|nr:MAG: NADH-quinone oxidoreductase subunit C [Euryarchaeota archaeon TMED192]|tara:strand:+ start:1214 stop:1876 length:663 start_codon:yes stop_codon:yes gene_type:complete
MGKRVIAENQNEAAMQLVNSLIALEGVTGEVLSRTNGTQTRNIAHLQCEPSSWRKVAETMKYDHEVDHCSMITGIHWPDSSDKNWEVIYHFLRTGVKDPEITEDGSSIIPNITEPKKLSGKEVPLEIQVNIAIPETRTPSVSSVQDIWVGADWNEKETWDLVGIDFDGHRGMRRVLNPHETPPGYHPLQKQHKLRYHGFEEMYDDAQGFLRKAPDSGRVK